MESSSTDVIISALQQLTIATYDSLRQFDRSYSFDTYRAGLRFLETRGQVKRLVFQVGKSERYAWLLPWYEDEALRKMEDFKNDAIEYLESTPSTSKQIREYFKGKHPAFHQIAYLAFLELVSNQRVSRLSSLDDLGSVNIYYLPEKRAALDGLLQKALEHVERQGSGVAQEISNSLGISNRLAFALLATLAHEGKISRFKVGWTYTKRRPVFVYCKEGHEAEAVARYRKMASEIHVQQKQSRLADSYRGKFSSACTEMKADLSLADLAGSYFERAAKSHWMRGRDSREIAWSAFFLANKILRQGITPGEVETYTKVERRVLLMVSRDLNDFLQLDVPDIYPNPTDYLDRIVARMKLRKRPESSNGLIEKVFLKKTSDFLASLPKTLFFGKRPESMVAAALYLTASELGIHECTQKRISKGADITEVTLRNTVKSIQLALPKSEIRGEATKGDGESDKKSEQPTQRQSPRKGTITEEQLINLRKISSSTQRSS